MAFRALCDAAEGNKEKLITLFADSDAIELWLVRWQARCQSENRLWDTDIHRADNMRTANPYIIPRNHRVEEALQAASELNNFSLFENLLAALENPFKEQAQCETLTRPAGASFTENYRTYCGT